MSRLQSIEAALVAINDTVFQELCDAFLILRNKNYSLFSRSGTQTAKQKTVKGTPDTFFLLPNGNYMFVEYSTNITEGVSKLEKDVIKCLDVSKTKIPIDSIEEVVLCTNFKIKTEEVERLKTLLAHTYIKLTIYSIDSLSVELHFNHRDLVNQYLGLPLDTGQIVSLKAFINEYNKGAQGIATPIDNPFVHRETEILSLKNLIEQNDFIIITGSAGVGKTKLCVETIDQFINQNSSYSAYCISDKGHLLLEDLHTHLTQNEDFILFVDDANRIDRFNQITGFYKGTRNGKLKIIITVRDYAFDRVTLLCQGFKPQNLTIKKFEDDQIKDIIEKDPFNILNPKYQKEIFRIADGNPRLAIMASLLARKEKNLAVLNNVGELFDLYFSSFIQDSGDFADKLNIKILGLIAFFNVLPYKDREIVEPILLDFGLDYNSFIDHIDQLEKLELVDIQFDYIKISEQNLATYFFYKAFIEEELLSFAVLLEKYFKTNVQRFEDTVIPANNNFGYERVMEKLQPHLKRYLSSIKSDESAAFQFIQSFWFYLQEETLEFIYEFIEILPTNDSEEYIFDEEKRNKIDAKSHILKILSEFLRTPNNKFSDVVELCFEYVKKNPNHYQELIHILSERLKFDFEDEGYKFYRQNKFVDHLIKFINDEDSIYVKAFFELAKNFLNFKFQQTKAVRGNAISIYQFPLKNDNVTKQFRAKIWNSINSNYDAEADMALRLLQTYGNRSPDVIKEIMENDVPFVIEIILKHLSTNNFDHCVYVQDQIKWFERCGIKNKSFQSLKDDFKSPLYVSYLKLDWDRYRDKEMFEFDNFEEYDRIKEVEIRNFFNFSNLQEIELFFKDFQQIRSQSKNPWNYNNVLDIIVEETFKNSFELGVEFLIIIAKNTNIINYVPTRAFSLQVKTEQQVQSIFKVLDASHFNCKSQWELSLIYNLDKGLSQFISEAKIIDVINGIDYYGYVYLDPLEKYQYLYPTIFSDVLEAIYKKNASNGFSIKLWDDVFEKDLVAWNITDELAELTYIQQFNGDQHYDFDGQSLRKLTRNRPQFIEQFIKGSFQNLKHNSAGEHRRYGYIWSIDDIDLILEETFNFIIAEEDNYGISAHLANAFFNGVESEDQEKANKFLISYLVKNSQDIRRVDAIVNVARNSRKDLFEKVLSTFLEHNQDKNAFAQIWWRGNGGIYHGDVNMGDEEASDWKRILVLIQNIPLGSKLIPIKKYVSDRIDGSLQSGDWERKRKFLSRS